MAARMKYRNLVGSIAAYHYTFPALLNSLVLPAPARKRCSCLLHLNCFVMQTISPATVSPAEKNLLQRARDLAPLLSAHVEEEVIARRLSPPVLAALREAGFLKLFLPKSLGGLEADPLTTARLVEEVARHNTAAGWSMMVANTSTWWCGRLPEEGVEELFRKGPDTFIAGAFHPPMKAIPTADGFTITGRNPLFSNVHEADWIYVSIMVMDGDKPKMIDGRPDVRGAYLAPQDCQIIDTWYTIGMCATDSNDVDAQEVYVPLRRIFPLVPQFQAGRHFEGLLYQFPAVGACVDCLLAPVALAVARNAIDELKAIAAKKTALGSAGAIREKGVVQRKLGEAEALVQSSRAYLFGKIAECWDRTLSGDKLLLTDKADLLLAAAHTNQSCARAVDLVYSAGGSSAIYARSKLSKYFSDAQVIRQHGFMNDSRYESAAQVYFDLPPDLPVIAF